MTVEAIARGLSELGQRILPAKRARAEAARIGDRSRVGALTATINSLVRR